jgi:ABC-type cobalamin transport system ATPase subunit
MSTSPRNDSGGTRQEWRVLRPLFPLKVAVQKSARLLLRDLKSLFPAVQQRILLLLYVCCRQGLSIILSQYIVIPCVRTTYVVTPIT